MHYAINIAEKLLGTLFLVSHFWGHPDEEQKIQSRCSHIHTHLLLELCTDTMKLNGGLAQSVQVHPDSMSLACRYVGVHPFIVSCQKYCLFILNTSLPSFVQFTKSLHCSYPCTSPLHPSAPVTSHCMHLTPCSRLRQGLPLFLLPSTPDS